MTFSALQTLFASQVVNAMTPLMTASVTHSQDTTRVAMNVLPLAPVPLANTWMARETVSWIHATTTSSAPQTLLAFLANNATTTLMTASVNQGSPRMGVSVKPPTAVARLINISMGPIIV